MGMWHGASVMGGTARGESPRCLPHCKGDSPMEQSMLSSHDHQSAFKSEHPSSSLPRRSPGVSQTPQTSFGGGLYI